MSNNLYRLLDCGDGQKLEMLGNYKTIRPCPQALWPKRDPKLWKQIDLEFERTAGEKGVWKKSKHVPDSWFIESTDGLKWQLQPNEFGNIGIFTEHWVYAKGLLDFFPKEAKVLNLFTYSGSNCVILAQNDLQVTAVDSSKVAMNTYTKNLELNNIDRNGQRLILEDVYKFLAREMRRGSKYDAIMADTPSYGRGTKGEVFKIEEDLIKILEACKQLVSETGKIILTLHSPRFTPAILRILTEELFPGKKVETAEIIQNCESGIELPSGFLVKIG